MTTAPPDRSPAPPESDAFEAHWAGLSPPERVAFEAEAVAAAPAFLQRQYHEGGGARGTLWRVTRRQILVDYFSSAGAREEPALRG